MKKIIRQFPWLLLLLLFTSCASLNPATFASETPKLDPVEFFGGRTSSKGVIENYKGKPTDRIITTTEGTVKDGKLFIEQDLMTEGKKTNHRSWSLQQIDEHHVQANSTDMDGTAKGLLYGNAFSWTYRMKLQNRKFIKHVRMQQNMYLMPNGNTLIIRSVIRKFGFTVAQITEQFTKN
jgi:hypothetical protein